ncbi:MAG: hypothetical protein WBG50_25845 [Desulfomonilaceae bacterium]
MPAERLPAKITGAILAMGWIIGLMASPAAAGNTDQNRDLIHAVVSDDLGRVTVFLERGTDVHAEDVMGATALMIAGEPSIQMQ